MDSIGTVTSKGQITIPRDIRKAVGLNPGDRVMFQMDEQHRVVMKKNPETLSLAGMLGSYGKGRTLTQADIQQAIVRGIAGKFR